MFHPGLTSSISMHDTCDQTIVDEVTKLCYAAIYTSAAWPSGISHAILRTPRRLLLHGSFLRWKL